jgi:hypothetical protein
MVAAAFHVTRARVESVCEVQAFFVDVLPVESCHCIMCWELREIELGESHSRFTDVNRPVLVPFPIPRSSLTKSRKLGYLQRGSYWAVWLRAQIKFSLDLNFPIGKLTCLSLALNRCVAVTVTNPMARRPTMPPLPLSPTLLWFLCVSISLIWIF